MLEQAPRLVALKYDDRGEDYRLLPEESKHLESIQLRHNPANQEYVLEVDKVDSGLLLRSSQAHSIFWSFGRPFVGNLVINFFRKKSIKIKIFSLIFVYLAFLF